MKRFAAISLIIGLLLAVALYLRPIPKVQVIVNAPSLPAASPVSIPWPSYGQAAFGAVGFGVLATNGSQTPVPIASIAKVVTALAVLQKKPLNVGQQGPTITLNSNDVALYQKYLDEDGSVIAVNDGEQISEYQMLQGMLLPSANNLAESLADWAFGSQTAYLSYANDFVSSLGLSQTHLDDASGFLPASVSSAHDLVILGEKALANPVLADIVGQQQAVIPVAGTVNNVDWLLGTDGVIGIKTGNTDQAGGCFLFAANRDVGGQQIKIIGAILGAPDGSTPSQAINDSRAVIESTDNNFQAVQVVKKGQAVGTYKTNWGVSVAAIASQNLSVVSWRNIKPPLTTKLNELSIPTKTAEPIGLVNIMVGQQNHSVPLVLQKNLNRPSVLWRIFHF